MDKLLSVGMLEMDLNNAEKQLASATADRLRATETENQWQTEVTSLRNLIQVRKQRMNPARVSVKEEANQHADLPTVNRTLEGHEDTLNRVDWIDALIEASGAIGISPPEIMQKAQKQGIRIHPNYPYVVLRNLVDKNRAIKKNGRYFRKQS